MLRATTQARHPHTPSGRFVGKGATGVGMIAPLFPKGKLGRGVWGGGRGKLGHPPAGHSDCMLTWARVGNCSFKQVAPNPRAGCTC
jgi:hypothetical protein